MNKAEKAVEQAKLDRERAVLKALTEHYEYALKGINERLQVLQSRPETQSNVYRKEYQQTMKNQVSAILENLHANVYQTIDDYMHDAYTTGFVGTMYDLHYQSVPLLIPINRDAVLKAVRHDTKLTSPLYDELGIDTKVMSKKISRELSRGLASGLTYDDIARNIRNTTKAPLARARNIARTEGHRIQQASAADARAEAKAKGADVVKQWDSTLDGDTRPNHRQLDGQIREVDEPFEVDGYRPMHPGDFGEASEDCNCRCVASTRARAALDEDELKTLRERAEYFGIDKSDSFTDFEKKYLKAAENVDNSGKSGIILAGENYVSNKGFVIHQDKIHKFLLRPGAKHYQEFADVGYRHREGYTSFEANLLALDINNGYDEAKITDRISGQSGAERYSIFMTLGFTGNKTFRTVWQKDTPDSKPRLITAHREDLQ